MQFDFISSCLNELVHADANKNWIHTFVDDIPEMVTAIP